MAVVLRLQRVGKPKDAHYRVVAIDKRQGPRGRALEIVGHYHPKGVKMKDKVTLAEDRVEHWLSSGAKPSDTVGSLIKQVRRAKKAAEAGSKDPIEVQTSKRAELAKFRAVKAEAEAAKKAAARKPAEEKPAKKNKAEG